ncbi:MAG: hypothetical protein A3E83_03310 [Gammaproteobacteria bacterium RIFCSPHIGHO2_12_FULL_41_20]|nr:MAG: hypothetical protein A3E83_03310 [Gammaproteobacteria bacterium RIFCSPHIGHO2_12_FULL_41_20]
MSYSLKPLALSLAILGLVSTSVFAANESEPNQQMEKINAQTQLLEKQLAKLQAEVVALKTQVKLEKIAVTAKKHQVVAKKTPKTSLSTGSGTEVPLSQEKVTPEASAPADTSVSQELILDPDVYMPFDIYVPGQSFVSTGPYIGVPIQYAGTNLVINNPSINQDVVLLKLRSDINKELAARGTVDVEGRHSHLLLSGVIEGAAYYADNGGGAANTSDINVTNVSLDGFLLGPTEWTSAYFELSYKDNVDTALTNYRSANSEVFINKAFIMLGNFDKSPIYSTIGQLYVPFGTYSSQMISSPFTKILARTKARTVVLGYSPMLANTFYASTYIFRGDSHASSVSRINNGGVNIGYKFDQGLVVGNVGAGVIGNLADSAGMQYTNNQPLFNGFGGPSPYGSEQLVHNVPAYNIRGLFSIGGHVDLLAEYVGASTRFNPNDMTFSGHGARPWAINTEAAYSFPLFNRPSSVGINYGQSGDALALGLPEKRLGAVFNTSWWRNTLQSLEFRHDIGYAASATSSGSNVTGPSGTGVADNVVTAQLDYYF